MRSRNNRKRPYYHKINGSEGLLEEVIVLSDFTDGAGATGYADLTGVLPAGAIPLAWRAEVTTGFATSAYYAPVDGTTIAFVDGGGAGDTITDSAEGFVTAGFEDGDQVTIAGATTSANNTTYTIVTVAAGTLTFATDTIDTAEAGIDGVTFTGISTATLMVGISGDTDRFSADTSQSVAAAGIVGSVVIAADAAKGMGSAVTVRVTLTEGSDFGEFNTGIMKLSIYYLETY